MEEENDVFCDAQESEGQGSQVVTPKNQEGEPKAQQTGQHEPEKAAQSQVHPQREAATQLGTRERGGRGNSGMEWCAGHVCLRLRPDGLRERCEEENRGEGGGEDEGRASEISGEGSEGRASVLGEEEVRIYGKNRREPAVARVFLYASCEPRVQ